MVGPVALNPARQRHAALQADRVDALPVLEEQVAAIDHRHDAQRQPVLDVFLVSRSIACRCGEPDHEGVDRLML